MPSKKRQYNIRLTDEQGAMLERLRAVLNAKVAGLELSVTDVFVVTLTESYERHVGEEAPRKGKAARKRPPGDG